MCCRLLGGKSNQEQEKTGVRMVYIHSILVRFQRPLSSARQQPHAWWRPISIIQHWGSFFSPHPLIYFFAWSPQLLRMCTPVIIHAHSITFGNADHHQLTNIFIYLINAYPLSLKIRISCMEPKLANVFCSSSSERPLAIPPQYTVQLVGLDWLYTSSKVKGLELAAKIIFLYWFQNSFSTPDLFLGRHQKGTV